MRLSACTSICQYLLTKIGIIEDKVSPQKANQLIEEEAKIWQKKDRKKFWAAFVNEQKFRIESTLLSKAVYRHQREGKNPGVVVELGCGISPSAIFLMYHGWKVIAIDSSPSVINIFRQIANNINPNWIQEGQLSIQCQEIETFEFPKNVQIIFAKDSLPYCDPGKIKQVWDRIYSSLETGGRFVGNLFPKPNCPAEEHIYRSTLGAWLANKPVVESLLNTKGYKIELCQYNKYWFQSSPKCVDFIAQKI